MFRNLFFGILTLITGGTGMARATLINNSTGLIGIGITPTYTLTFNNAGMSANSPITNQFTFAGVTFSTPAFYDGNNGGFGNCNFSNESGDCVTNYTTSAGAVTSVPGTPFSIFFAVPQTYAAFALVTDASGGNNNTTITALRNNVIVDQGTFTTSISGPNTYYGFYGENTPFDTIRISTTGANLVILDNLSVQSTPEPGTIGLLAGGLGGVVVLVRRRRSA